MTEQNPKNKVSLLLKLAIALLILVTITAGIRIALKSDWLLDYARGIAIEQANAQINGELTIDSIRGDLLFGVTIYDIDLKDNDQQDILAIDSLQVRYTLPSLLMVPYRLDLLHVSGMKGNFVQQQDSVWNVEQLIPTQDSTAVEDESDPLYWEVNQIIVERADLSIQSDIMLPDGFLDLENINLQAAAEVFPDRWYASVDELDLRIREGRLPSPIDLSMQAVAMDEQITLETLVINSGRTLLQSNGQLLNQNELSGNVIFEPLSTSDIAAYVEKYPIRRDLNIGISFEGDFEDFWTTISIDAGSGGTAEASAQTNISDPFILNELNIELNQINGFELLGDTTLPDVNYVRLNGSGAINMMEPEFTGWEGSLQFNQLSMQEYSLDQAGFDYSVNQGTASLNGQIRKESEVIEIAANASDIFSEIPVWSGRFSTRGINLATWLNDPAMDSDLTLDADIDGRGIQQSDLQSQMNLVISSGRFGNQPFSELTFSGQLSPREISGALMARITESIFRAETTIDEWASTPKYAFDLRLEEVNMADFSGLEEFPTYINGRMVGEGSSFDIESLAMTATAELDSTIINGQPIDTLRSDFRIENQILHIENSVLESPIADADFSLRQHLTDFNDLRNRLEFTAQIKDLYPFAPLLGVDQLLAGGSLDGLLERNGSGELEFNGNLSLEDVVIDTLFSSEKIIGNVNILLLDDPQAEARLELAEPVVMEQSVQDFILTATALITDNETSGNIGFELINDEESRLTHSGVYSLTEAQSLLTTNRLDFETPARILSLRNPFDSKYINDILSVDTLRVQTDDEYSYLELWAPHVDSLSQNAGLNAQNLNIGVLQRTLVGDDMVDGYLSASIQLNNSPDSLALAATGLLSSVKFENGEMDSLRFSSDIEQEWLDLSLAGWHDDSELFRGHAKVPFLPGDPLTFDDQFFDREIEGSFRLNETEANYWLSFMPGDLVEETSGILSFSGEMKGKAGVPEFDGELKFKNGRLSGVPIDSVDVQLMYDHELENIGFSGSVISRSERVLDYNSEIPFKLDLREIEILLPTDEDSLQIDLQTRNFNLAVVNDFVDRQMVRQVSGRINGDVTVSGTLGNLQPNGSLALSGGSMQVVPAGITISNISSQLNFSPELIELQQFSMQSGPGRIRSSGTVEIDNLEPGAIDISIRGAQFRAVNTQDYNAIVDLQSNITGTIDEPKLQGSISFLNGFVNLQNFGERAVEEVTLEDEEEVDPLEFYDSMDIEMVVNFNRQFFIRNRQFLDLEIELGGQVDLLKRPFEDLEMFGQVEGVRGYARPLGKNFEIDEATVTFSGPIDDPELNVRTVYEPPQARTEVKIFYIIEGTAQDPDFRFESEPDMELQDIFSYTVFGKPFYELESWEQAVAGSGGGPSATDVALDVLLDRVELLASQRLGIDVVQIDNSRTGSDSNTSILTGWYLNRRTFFALVNEISTTPKTLFLLEYMLRENLELIITQGDDSRQGVDLRWKLDY